MMQQLLARCRGWRRLANHVDYRQHVQQDAGVVATGVAEHVEGGAEQVRKGGPFQDKTQRTVPVIVHGIVLALLDERRQAIPQMIQASHGRERVVDRRRHGAHSHFGELIDRVDDILGRSAHVAKLESAADQLFAWE